MTPSWSLRLADAVVAWRRPILVLFAVATVGFALGLNKVRFETVYSDLLPQTHPFVETFRDHPDFGSPLTLLIMVQNRHGDIYNRETLALVNQLTRDIDLSPGVDHTQIVSIATEKARYSHATAFGIDMRPLMDDQPPASDAEITAFRQRVDKAPVAQQFLISQDQTATLISATFIENRVDWGAAFEYAQALVEQARDEQHDVMLYGQPALYGWIYRYENQMWALMGLAVAILIAALLWQSATLRSALPPVLCSATAAIWAFGLVGWLDISIDPLLMVVPLLLLARSFSHSVQFSARFQEYIAAGHVQTDAARHTLAHMFKPSVLSILTDVLGIVVVAAAPIPAMVRHAIFCGMWAFWLIPTGVILITAVLATLPAPRADRPPRKASFGLLRGLARLHQPSLRYPLLLLIIVTALVSTYTASKIRIGNPVQGSYLLAEASEFNQAARKINEHFAGISTLEIILQARDESGPEWTVVAPDTIRVAQTLQREMEHGAFPPKASLTFADYLGEVNRLYNGGDVRWLPLDLRERALTASAVAAMMGSSSEAYNHVIDAELKHATVSFWYADNTQDTVDQALAAARDAVASVGVEHEQFEVRLATGSIALQQAMNTIVADYHFWIVAALNLVIFCIFSLSHRSAMTGLILLAPVNLAHQSMIAVMHVLGIGLDVNSMIVAAIGLGVGIDYGIYLMERIREEYAASGSLQSAVEQAIGTTGQAIVFTAGVMALSILPIAWLSDLQFVADMATLIICIMAANLVAALVVLPCLVALTHRRVYPQRVPAAA